MSTKKWYILGLMFSFGIAMSAVPVFSDTTTTDAIISATVDGCGDNEVDIGESCDGSDLDGQTCSSQGFTGGTLSCSASCTFVTSSCTDTPTTGCTGDCASPQITNWEISATSRTISASWTATDDVAIQSCTLRYSLDESYDTVAVTLQSGDDYTSITSSLEPETAYNYQLICLDTSKKSSSVEEAISTTALSADIIGPVIDITSTDPSQTACIVNWTAEDENDVDTCAIVYGVDDSYGNGGDVTGSYTSKLSPLLPNTSYEINVTCLDTLGNKSSETTVCKTAADAVPPPPITDLIVTPGNTLNTLAWTYSAGISDFLSYTIRHSTASCPASITDGDGALAAITDVAVTSATDVGLINGTEYFYSVFVVDTSGNASTPVCASGIPFGDVTPPGSEICTDGIDNDGDTDIDCADSDCTLDPACTLGSEICTDGIDNDGDTDIDCADNDCAEHVSCIGDPPDSEICTDGIDNDTDGFIDCDDNDCSAHPSCGGGRGDPEICTDGIDNDIDGFIDCADSDCASAANCKSGPTGGGTELICNDGVDNDSDGFTDCADTDCSEQPACIGDIAACNDGFDNDGDGYIDLLDPGCESIDDLDEYNEPDDVIIGGSTIQPEQVMVYIAERTIGYQLSADAVVSTLTGDQLSLKVTPVEASPLVLKSVVFHVGKQAIPFYLNIEDDNWYVDSIVPAVGMYDVTIEYTYTTGRVSVNTFELASLPYGQVAHESDPLSDVIVKLVRTDASLFPADVYRQFNPQITGANGTYGYVVPNGDYQLILSKDNYRVRTSRTFTVRNNVINDNFKLLKIPETPLETVAFIGDIVLEEASDFIAEIDEIADDPQVEQVTKTIVAPAAVGIAAAATIPSLWSILFPLLRFLFLQPILIFSKKRRRQYGIVYNSLTKTPLDLVVVRLVDFETEKVVQSHVTNKQGQYVFIPEVGTYKIVITKQDFVFPSKFLLDKKTDGKLVDIYHGEKITVGEDGAYVAPNIPVDPIVADKTPKRMYFQKLGLILQHIIAISGILITLVSLYISPVWYLWVFLGVHILLFILFKRYTKPRKPDGWGIVYNTKNKKPLGRVVARLFSKEYNKLVATELTDGKGHYAFLAGSNDYYVTFEKEGFDLKKEEISIKEDGIISNNVPLDPKE